MSKSNMVQVGNAEGNTFVTFTKSFLKKEGFENKLVDKKNRLLVSSTEFSKLLHNFYKQRGIR